MLYIDPWSHNLYSNNFKVCTHDIRLERSREIYTKAKLVQMVLDLWGPQISLPCRALWPQPTCCQLLVTVHGQISESLNSGFNWSVFEDNIIWSLLSDSLGTDETPISESHSESSCLYNRKKCVSVIIANQIGLDKTRHRLTFTQSDISQTVCISVPRLF